MNEAGRCERLARASERPWAVGRRSVPASQAQRTRALPAAGAGLGVGAKWPTGGVQPRSTTRAASDGQRPQTFAAPALDALDALERLASAVVHPLAVAAVAVSGLALLT